MVGNVVKVNGRRILLQELNALHAYLVKLLMRRCMAILFGLDLLLKPEHAVLLIGLVLLRQDDLVEGDRARVVQVEMRLVI